MRILYLILIVTTCAVLGPRGVAHGGEMRLQLSPINPEEYKTAPEGERIAPAAGELIVIGQIAGKDFQLTDIRNLCAVNPDGAQIPVTFDLSSQAEEFGEIYAVRVFFRIPAEKEEAPTPYLLRWGPEVESENSVLDTFIFVPGVEEQLRGFIPLKVDADATLKIVADRKADLYGLWYLLPMGLVFLLLTIRKLKGRHVNQ